MPFNEDGTPWSPETGHLALQEIRKTAIADLNARDERLSRGQLNAANHYSPYREVQKEHGQGSSFVVDPLLSSIRHSGEETILLTEKRWREFTSEPQDEAPYRDKLAACTKTERLNAAKCAGQGVEDSLGAVPESEMPVLPTRKPAKEPALIG